MQDLNRDEIIDISIKEIIGIVIHKMWLILLVGLILGGIGYSISKYVITPQYISTTKIYILNKSDNNALTYNDTQLATQLTKDYEELITCRYVLETVIKQYGLEDDYNELLDRVSVKNTSDTRIIGIEVKDSSPSDAQFIANAIRDVASEHITRVMDIEAVNIVDEANLPNEPTEPSIILWTTLAAFLGCFITTLILIVRFMADDTIKTSEDIEKYLGFSTLAIIPIIQEQSQKGINSEGKRKKHKRKKGKNEVDVTPYETNKNDIKNLKKQA